ncbi:glycosyltransferase family protein [Halovulum sp. GXIMD14793]
MAEVECFPISLVIVSDFEAGPKTWSDEDSCLRACLSDAAGIPGNVVIAASASDKGTPPPDWSDLPVPVKIVFVDSEKSGEIKNGATAHTQHDLVAVVEADCQAVPGWLVALHRIYQQDPALDAVTGLTSYEPATSMRRVMALYDRGYLLDTLQNGDAEHISNNGALYRKSLLEQYPYGPEASPFVSAEIRHHALRAAGVRVGLTRDAIQYHAYEGWPFIVDVRKNKGLQHQIMREASRGPYKSSLARFFGGLRRYRKGISQDWRSLRRSFSFFCKWHDLPLAIVMPLILRFVEGRGTSLAQAGHDLVPNSSYR